MRYDGRRAQDGNFAYPRQVSMYLLPANLTFKYEFTVAKFELRMREEFRVPSEKLCWVGQGNGQADDEALQRETRLQAVRDAMRPAERARVERIAKWVRAGLSDRGIEDSPACSPPHAEGLVGPKPHFELCSGWLTLLPTEGWTQPLPLRMFSDAEVPGPGNHHEKRNLKSFSFYVGEALQKVLRASDTLGVSRNETGAFSYSLERKCELILIAGCVVDEDGPVALWQEYDSEPNPNAGQSLPGRPNFRFAERISLVRPYVSVSVNDQVFHLLEGQDLYIDPYYVFLARSNYNNKGLHLLDGHHAPAVYSAGRIGELQKELTKELVRNASQQLTASMTRIL
jgi:hypothetical protein